MTNLFKSNILQESLQASCMHLCEKDAIADIILKRIRLDNNWLAYSNQFATPDFTGGPIKSQRQNRPFKGIYIKAQMKLIETIKEHTIQLIVSAIFGVLCLIVGALYSEALLIVLPIVIQEMPKTLLLKWLLLATTLCVLLFVLSLYQYFQLRNKLIPKFGVKWDKNKEAYCPNCDIPLSNSRAEDQSSFHSFQCLKCNSDPYLSHLGAPISLSEALDLLDKP